MDARIHPTEYGAAPYDPAIDRPLGRDFAGEIMGALRRKMEQVNVEGTDGLDSMPPTFTIREAAKQTGRPRHEIYRLIQENKINARMAPGGPPLWLIPREELQKLMPNPPGDSDTSGPA